MRRKKEFVFYNTEKDVICTGFKGSPFHGNARGFTLAYRARSETVIQWMQNYEEEGWVILGEL